MKAAVITKPGSTPVFADFDDPVPKHDEELITVTASALSHVTKSRASGSHHTSPGSLPAVVGIDGVGRTQDGRRVYFMLPKEPFGGEGVDVVLDYLWGPSAETLIVAAAKAGKDAVPICFVQIGAPSGGNIVLPSAALRSSALVLMGSGIGSIPFKGLVGAIRSVLQAVVPGKLKIETKVVPLAEVEETWNKDSGNSRVVFVVKQKLEGSASL